jgi:hypothetical protein
MLTTVSKESFDCSSVGAVFGVFAMGSLSVMPHCKISKLNTGM